MLFPEIRGEAGKSVCRSLLTCVWSIAPGCLQRGCSLPSKTPL